MDPGNGLKDYSKQKVGKKMDKNLLKKLRGKLIKGTPKLRKKFNLHTKKQQQKTKHKKKPKWFKKLGGLFKLSNSRDPKGIHNIKKTLRNHGFDFKRSRWHKIKHMLRNAFHTPAVQSKLKSFIAKHTPSIRPRAMKKKYIPKWYKHLVLLLKSQRIKNPQGKKEAKKALRKHATLLSHKSINQIIRLAHHGKLSGQVLRKLQKKNSSQFTRIWLKKKGKNDYN